MFAMSDGNAIILLVVLCAAAFAVKRGMDKVKNFYCGLGWAVYNSPIASSAAKHGAAYFLRQLFR